MDVSRYVQLHPAASHLRSLDRELKALQRSEPGVSLSSLEAPAPIDLPAVAPPEAPPPPDLIPDRERARGIVRDEFTFRRLARPDRYEERYQSELARLRRRYLEARVELPETETQPQLADAARRAREMDRLERRIRELDDLPARRALLSLEELRERRTQREQAQRALDDLRREEIRRLRDALTVPRRQPRGEPEIPAAELARIARERNEGKAEADLQLIQEEQKALAHLETETLPPPSAAETRPFVPAPDSPLAPKKLAVLPGAAPRPSAVPALRPTQNALREAHRALQAAILRDLMVVSREAARRQGIELHPKSAGVPDRTLELWPAVGRLVTAAPVGIIQRTSKSGKTHRREGKER